MDDKVRQLRSPIPACVSYSALVPEGFLPPEELVSKIQSRLVDVWQVYIGRWHAQSLAPMKRFRPCHKQPRPGWYTLPLLLVLNVADGGAMQLETALEDHAPALPPPADI